MKTPKLRSLLAFVSVLFLCLAASLASATTLTWNTCDGSGPSNNCTPQNPGGGTIHESVRTTSGSNPNKTWTFDALEPGTGQVDVRAFRTGDTLGGGIIAPTKSTIWGGGMGAGYETSSPQHAVDNFGYDEFLVFQLPANGMTPLSFRIGWRGSDADISTWIGGTLGGPNDAFTLLSSGFSWDATGGGLTSPHGYVQQDFLNVQANVSQLFTNDASGAYLIIAARNEVDYTGSGRYLTIKDGGEDAFKVMQVVVDTPSVPQPGTLLLLGSGLVGLGLRWRRRARTA